MERRNHDMDVIQFKANCLRSGGTIFMQDDTSPSRMKEMTGRQLVREFVIESVQRQIDVVEFAKIVSPRNPLATSSVIADVTQREASFQRFVNALILLPPRY